VVRPGFDNEARPLALIVEDEFLIAMALEALLTSHGWRVLGPAMTVDGALHILTIARPHVAILDLNVGARMVTPVGEVLHASGIPFLVSSGFSQGEVIGDLGILAEVPWIPKPIHEERLLATLDWLLRQ
jgi:DNA-binding response OmpR family regulator